MATTYNILKYLTSLRTQLGLGGSAHFLAELVNSFLAR